MADRRSFDVIEGLPVQQNVLVLDDVRPQEAETRPRKTTPGRFTPTWLSDITIGEDPPYLIDGVLPLGPSFGVTFGQPGSLKTFFLMHLLLHVAAGKPWCGRSVMPGAVLYVTGEGVPGVRRRLIAMREHLNIQAAPFGLISVMPNLGTGTEDRAALIKEIRTATAGLQVPLRAIAIDTLRRAIPGKAENKQEDMSVFVNNCGEIAASFGAHIHTIHHTPRADDSHGSGSNALDAASDVMLRVRRVGDTNRSTAKVDRLKDGPDKANGASFGFELVPLQVGADHNGDPVTSCSVDITEDKEAPKVARSTTKKVGGRPPRNNTVFVNAFTEALDHFGERIRVRGDGPQVRAVDVQRVRDEFKRRYATGEGDTKKQTGSANKAFARVLQQLPSQFATETRDRRELIWRFDQ